MNYSIIKDEKELKEFINWLPDLLPNEIFMLNLFTRSKYCKDENGNNLFPHVRTDKAQLVRKTSTKERLFHKIKQMECELGSYKLQNGMSVPQESLALYITLNPRDMQKAAKESLKRLADLVTIPYNGFNPHQEVLSEIQRANGRKLYYDLDFDNVEVNITIIEILKYINSECLTILKTRGGFHCLIEFSKIDKQYEKSWFKNLTSIKGADIDSKSSMIPVVGCTHGNSIPKFIKI
jgi:hypothetical protein